MFNLNFNSSFSIARDPQNPERIIASSNHAEPIMNEIEIQNPETNELNLSQREKHNVSEKYSKENEKSLTLRDPNKEDTEINPEIDESKYKKTLVKEDYEWRYLEDDGTYIKYDSSVTELIENAFQTNYHELIKPDYKNYSICHKIQVGGCSYEVQFSNPNMIHRQVRKNSNLQTVRTVRRFVKGENIVEKRRNYIWKWLHESGEFKEYEPDVNFLIEVCYIEYNQTHLNPIVLVQGSNEKTYQIDFSIMQQLNEKTRFKRYIKRETLNMVNIIDYEWRWQDNDHTFKKYNINIMKSIENAFQIYWNDKSQNTFCFKSENFQRYMINFKSMSQSNIKTNLTRKITRIPINEESKLE